MSVRDQMRVHNNLPTNQPTKSNLILSNNPNPTTKQHAIVNIQLNIVSHMHYVSREIRAKHVIASSVRLWVVIITLPLNETCSHARCARILAKSRDMLSAGGGPMSMVQSRRCR